MWGPPLFLWTAALHPGWLIGKRLLTHAQAASVSRRLPMELDGICFPGLASTKIASRKSWKSGQKIGAGHAFESALFRSQLRAN
jgi:hypothetical protein